MIYKLNIDNWRNVLNTLSKNQKTAIVIILDVLADIDNDKDFKEIALIDKVSDILEVSIDVYEKSKLLEKGHHNLMSILKNIKEEQKKCVMSIIATIILADGVIHSDELTFGYVLAREIGFSARDFDLIIEEVIESCR